MGRGGERKGGRGLAGGAMGGYDEGELRERGQVSGFREQGTFSGWFGMDGFFLTPET
jgi:hypothetical protein